MLKRTSKQQSINSKIKLHSEQFTPCNSFVKIPHILVAPTRKNITYYDHEHAAKQRYQLLEFQKTKYII